LTLSGLAELPQLVSPRLVNPATPKVPLEASTLVAVMRRAEMTSGRNGFTTVNEPPMRALPVTFSEASMVSLLTVRRLMLADTRLALPPTARLLVDRLSVTRRLGAARR